jgi:hypothetical protein
MTILTFSKRLENTVESRGMEITNTELRKGESWFGHGD